MSKRPLQDHACSALVELVTQSDGGIGSSGSRAARQQPGLDLVPLVAAPTDRRPLVRALDHAVERDVRGVDDLAWATRVTKNQFT
jgi:hypothetical protein